VSATIYAANWKMHLAPGDGRALVQAVLGRVTPRADRTLLFFPPAVALPAVAESVAGRADAAAGIQNVHWEPKGAFTGEISAPMAAASGAAWALIGHSERRHKFGETDEETGRKVRAVQGAGLNAMLCVGETIEQRRAGATESVVVRQLAAALDGLDAAAVGRVVVAYEPVWAIGTGLNATPTDAAAVHRVIRAWMAGRVLAGTRCRILYGGSVNAKNAAELLAQDELDGVLVGGASLEAESWVSICSAR
jgi:triosephosphate isomerase